MAEKSNGARQGIGPGMEGKAALITGGTRGIGKAIAERLLREGSRVAVCGTKQETVDAAVAELSAWGEAAGFVADVSKFEQVKKLVSLTNERLGGIDILINNAGAGLFKSVADRAGGIRPHGRAESFRCVLLLPRSSADIQTARRWRRDQHQFTGRKEPLRGRRGL